VRNLDGPPAVTGIVLWPSG